MKSAFRFILLGAALGMALMGWVAPSVISWYFNPPVELAVTCKAAVEWGISAYQEVVLIGTAVGGVVGIVAFQLLRRRGMRSGGGELPTKKS